MRLRWAARGRARDLIRALPVCLAILVWCQPARADGDALEYAIKATYLYKFASFIGWPPGVFAAPVSPLHLCVVGDDPFGDLLDRAVSGRRFGDRPIEVRRLPTADRHSGCQIMYIGGSPAQSVADALAAVHGTPVVTVTDSASDAGARGIINFVVRDNRVRFEIDDRAASENGIMISSKLLNLAVSVTRRG